MNGPVLIAGADSKVGAALVAHTAASGRAVIETTRRDDPRRLRIDLARPDTWPALPAVESAVICAAMTSLDGCERDPAAAAAVNAAGAAELARGLAASGAYVLLLSTNQVFDGARAHRGENEPPSPRTVYGRTKADGEAGALDAGASVLRLTKVLTPALPVLETWRGALAAQRKVQAFTDMALAPVTMSFVCTVIAAALAARPTGVLHASGDTDISYADVARALAQALGVDPALVGAASVADSTVPPAAAPRYATLGMDRTTAMLGIEPQQSLAAVASVVGQLRPDRARRDSPSPKHAAFAAAGPSPGA